MVDNSLNIGSSMGLDKILKRAIEKVRESRVQDLSVTKNGTSREDEDSLERINRESKGEMDSGKRGEEVRLVES